MRQFVPGRLHSELCAWGVKLKNPISKSQNCWFSKNFPKKMLLKRSPDTLDLVHSQRPDQSVKSTAFYLGQYIISYLYLLFLAFFLDEFYFRWFKIKHYRDSNESSNSCFDSVVCDYLK